MQLSFWDERYSEPEGAYGKEPNEFLREQAHRLGDGARVLCLGEGEGRNAVWLAERGCQVVAVDASSVGLQRTRELAAERGVSVETRLVDLATFEPEPGAYDAAVCIFVHLRDGAREFMHEQAMRSLRVGGVFLAELFSKRQLSFESGGPKDPRMLYTVEALQSDFASTGMARVLMLEECEVELREGKYHRGRAAVIRVLMQRT